MTTEVSGSIPVAAAPPPGGAAASRRAVLRSLGATALSRVLVLPVSAVLGIVVTRLIIDHYGKAAYGQYMLLVGIAALLPFADLGISASIVNVTAAATDPRSDERLRLTLVTCLRTLAACASVVIGVSVVLTVSGAWPAIFGAGLHRGAGEVAAGLCLGIVGLSLLVSFGERLLMGLGRYHVVVLLRVLQTPIVLTTILLALWLGIGIGDFVAVSSYAGTVVISVVALWLAARRINPVLGQAVRDAWRVRSVRGERVFDAAWPMLVQMIALPLAMQSDRIVLSQVSTLEQLTQYSLASQMFNPIIAVVATAGLSLWPIFAKARAGGHGEAISPERLSLAFAAVAVLLAATMVVASGPLAQLASGGEIALGLPLVLAYAAFVVVQAAKNPFGTYLMDVPGLRFQAAMVVLMLPVNLGLSIVLARWWGAVGPVIGSVIAVALFQIAANWWRVRRRRRP